MKTIATWIILLCMSFALAAQDLKPRYNPDTGRPYNCRAAIADNVRGWRAGQFTAQETMLSIERNCGPCGYIWPDAKPEDKERGNKLMQCYVLRSQLGLSADDCHLLVGLAECSLTRP